MVSSAARVGSINVLFEVQFGQAVAGADRFASAIERGGQRMQRSVRDTDRSVLGLNQTIARLNGRQFNVLALSALRAQNSVDRLRGVLLATSALAGGLSGAFALRSAVEYSDTYKTIGNRLRVVKGEAQDLRDIQKDIFDVAQRSRAQYEATGILFARIAGSARRLGIAQRDVLRVTETIQKSFLVGGATPVEAAQSSIQLSQGIASNRLQGDELRSVLENPALGQLLADRISGGDLGKLREMAAAGELTAKVIINAFKGASEEIDRLFESTEQTVGQALIKIDNALMRYIGTSQNANTASRATVSLLEAMAENFEGIADTVVTVGAALATAFAGRGANAIAMRSRDLRTLRIDQAAAAAAALQQANAEKVAAAQTLASTRAAYEMSKAQTVSNQTRSKFGRELQGALARDLAATRALTIATQQHAVALRAASVSGMAFAAAGRAASAAWAFVGGRFGALLLAAGAAYYLLSSRSEALAERTARLKEEMERLGIAASTAADGVKDAKKSLEDLAADELRRKLGDVTAEIERITQAQNPFDRIFDYDETNLGNLLQGLQGIQRARGPSANEQKRFAAALAEIVRQAINAEKPVDELQRRLNEIAEKDITGSMDDYIERIRRAIGYLADLNKYNDRLQSSTPSGSPLGDAYREYGRSREEGRQNDIGIGKMLDERSADARRTAWEAEVDKRADAIVKAADELGLSISQGAAKIQAEQELISEGVSQNLNDAVEAFVNRVVKAESGGDRFAKNPNSSAEGLGQFIDATWLDQYKKVFENAKTMTDAEILALKTNSEISKRLIENYGRENAEVLQRAGIAVQSAADEYKLQLAHFLGPQGAIKVLSAAPGTPVAGLLDPAAIKANQSILGGGATVDDVIRYAMKRAGASDTDVGGGRKDAEDQFEASLQGVRDRTAALREEAAALGLSHFEQVRREISLELEQEALKQVREEARRKGDQDWQNAQISAEQRAKIDEVSRALAAQATQTKLTREQQDALNSAGSAYGSLIRGLLDGTVEWKDALMQVGTILLKLLNDMNLAKGGLGIFGGGLFQSLIGGLLGLSFHSGGTVGAGGSVGALPLGAPYIGKRHSGGDIGRPTTSHREVLAALELGETVLTADQTKSVVRTMNAMANQLNGGRQRVAIEVGVAADNNGNLRPFVQQIADQSSRQATGALARQVPSMVDNRVKVQQTRGVRP